MPHKKRYHTERNQAKSRSQQQPFREPRPTHEHMEQVRRQFREAMERGSERAGVKPTSEPSGESNG